MRSVWDAMAGCQCPPFWHGIYPPPCPVHNPSLPTQTITWTDEWATLPSIETIDKILKEAEMKFRNEAEREAWKEYVAYRTPVMADEEMTAGERRARMVQICEEADWLIEEMRRRG